MFGCLITTIDFILQQLFGSMLVLDIEHLTDSNNLSLSDRIVTTFYQNFTLEVQAC